MKFRLQPISGPRRAGNRLRAGFTLAEVLAALVFMAIVIPVIIQGLSIASRAGQVAERKTAATRVAERVLNESIITTNWNQSSQGGSVTEGARQFTWTLRNEAWIENPMRLLTVDVKYSVQGNEYSVRLSTLADGSTPFATGSSGIAQQ